MTLANAKNQNEYWSNYPKKDKCFLSDGSDSLSAHQAEFARRYCSDLKGKTVLEIGCGDGSDAMGMVREFGVAKVIAIDVAEGRVEAARQKIAEAGMSDRVEVRVMDAHKLDFADATFDLAYCNSVLLFLDRDRFFPEITRVLKPGARLLVLRESLEGNPLLKVYRDVLPLQWKRGAEKFARRMTVEEIEDAGRKYFQSVEHQEHFLLFTLLHRLPHWVMNRLVRDQPEYEVHGGEFWRTLDAKLLERLPVTRPYAWIAMGAFETRSAPQTH